MRVLHKFILIVATGALTALLAAAPFPEPAQAQFGDLGRAFKKAVPKILPKFDGGQGSSKSKHGSSGGGSSDQSDDSSSTESSGSASTEVKKEIDRLEKARLLRNAVATEEEAQEERRAQKVERQRNVEKAIDEFISCLKGLHGLPSKGFDWLCEAESTDATAKGSEISQVTAGEIVRALNESYRRAHLQEFERLAGELWTRDRLLVRVIDRSRRELPPYFKGVGSKGPSMDELRKVFDKVAQEVYSRALEVNEVVGVSNSFDRFIRTVYENTDENAWIIGYEAGEVQGVDGRYERIATAALNTVPREKIMGARDGGDLSSAGYESEHIDEAPDPLGIERQFRFRFRARRVYYDCLSEAYTNIGRTITAPARSIDTAGPVTTPEGGGSAVTAGTSGAEDAVAPAPAAQSEGEIDTGALATSLPVDASATEVAWVRAQQSAHGRCRGGIDRVAKLALERKIRPESARWTSGFNLAPTAPEAGGQDNGLSRLLQNSGVGR